MRKFLKLRKFKFCRLYIAGASQGVLGVPIFDAFHPIRKKKTFLFNNRPFYRYGGHIEINRFKEYYRLPRGHEHISFVFSSAFRDIFS